MIYKNVITGRFLNRPNRFIAQVEIDGHTETVHVKNTGRCRELLIPGAEVILEVSDNPKRKTKYDLISVYKEGAGWVNIDSQAPNYVVREWLGKNKQITYMKPEYVYGDSRIDFYFERGKEKVLMEVKGVTLEREGIGYFPDAPTLRGIKHLEELIKARGEGYTCYLGFVIQVNGIDVVYPNDATHKEFGETLKRAEEAGVKIIYFRCHVTENELEIYQEAEKENR